MNPEYLKEGKQVLADYVFSTGSDPGSDLSDTVEVLAESRDSAILSLGGIELRVYPNFALAKAARLRILKTGFIVLGRFGSIGNLGYFLMGSPEYEIAC